MLEKVRDTIQRRRLIAPGEHLLVAVSGGADSMALLYVLYWLRNEYAFRLTIAHLDHGIRQDTAEDLRVVKWAAEDLGLSLIYKKRDVPSFARKHKLNLEGAGRIVRRQFLENAARKTGAEVIALGHTRTDLAETVLLHLLRGAGPGGLRGLLFSTPPYVRPLLACSREETRAFCRKHAIPFHDDPTNQDTRYLRNAIRLELLPQLARYNPRAEEALARAGELWAEAEEALDWATKQALTRVEGEGAIDVAHLRGLPRSVQALVVRAAAAAVLGDTRGLERVHIEQALRLVAAGKPGELSLPGGARVYLDRDRLWFGHGEERQLFRPVELPFPGEAKLQEPGWRFQTEQIPRPESLVPPSPFVAYLDPGKVKPPLIVRPRRPGDRVRPLGLPGKKKIKDLLMEARVPRGERDRWPLVCDQKGIAWVVGVRIAEDYKVEPGSTEVIRVKAERL